MTRPKHFDEYADITEVVPGVFVEPGEAVYIVDNQGEVISWNSNEWAEDPDAVTATVNAVALAAMQGAEAVRVKLFCKDLLSVLKKSCDNKEDN